MEFKGTEGVVVYLTQSGKIAIQQDNYELGKQVAIYMTLHQFRHLQNWVNLNEGEINEAWNDGVDNG